MNSNLSNLNFAADPLKGLLMDKGAEGLADKIQNLLHKLSIVHTAMDELVKQQRLTRDEVGSEALDLYLATNLCKELVGDPAVKALSPGELTVDHTKGPLALEWRARLDFGNAIGSPRSARVYAFQKDHPHYDQLRAYVNEKTPSYYETLVGYDNVRVTLNSASRQLRKMILDLNSVYQDTGYIQASAIGTKASSGKTRRILSGLQTGPELMTVLTGLYC